MTAKKTSHKPKRARRVKELASPTIDESSRRGIHFNEVGTTGLQAWSGFVSEAYNTALTYPGCIPLFNKMWQSDPEMAIVRNGFTTWGRRVSIQIKTVDNPNDDDKKAQEFYQQVFEDAEGGFSQLLEIHVARTPFYGVSYFETPNGLRNPDWKPPNDIDGEPDEWRSQFDDELYGIRRFAFRNMSTFYRWDLTEKGKKLKGMYQQDFPNEPVLIPLDMSLHLTVGDPTNPEGLPGLIPVWRLSRLQQGYETVFGIGSERTAGYLKINKTEAGTLSTDDKSAIATTAKNILSAQEGNYAYFPAGLDGSIIDTPFSSAASILEAMRHYSLLKLSVFMMQFVGLNTMTSTGALASASDSSSMSVMAFNGILDAFADQLDAQIGRRLWDINHKQMGAFPNATKRPKIEVTHIEKDILLGELGQFVSQIDGILQLGTDDKKAIRVRSGFLPENEPDNIPEAQAIDAMNKKNAVIPPNPSQSGAQQDKQNPMDATQTAQDAKAQ